MATLGGTTIGVSSFSSSSSSSSSNFGGRNARLSTSSSLSLHQQPKMACKSVTSRGFSITCSAVQESSSSSSTVEVEEAQKEASPAKAKAKPAKAAAKPLGEMMNEDIIPPLKTILESQNDISEINLSFQDNKLEGSFLKKGYSHSFWAFFPDGTLTGAKGFCLASYGSVGSTVEPFLIDEKKITAKLVVFWVEKRLAAQGIIYD